MFIDKDTLLRVNINASYKGFSRLDTEEIRAMAGVVEIPEPTPPADYSEDTYYRTEQNEAPYVIYTKKSDEQIAKLLQDRTNITARRYLADTDWYVSRFSETGVAIPDEIKAARQAARDSIVDEVPNEIPV